jgi:hypothetical protein
MVTGGSPPWKPPLGIPPHETSRLDGASRDNLRKPRINEVSPGNVYPSRVPGFPSGQNLESSTWRWTRRSDESHVCMGGRLAKWQPGS